MPKQKKKRLTIEEKFSNVEKLLAQKEQRENGKEVFEKVVKKISKPKPRFVK